MKISKETNFKVIQELMIGIISNVYNIFCTP
jgi:hypothetical protein